MSLILKLDLNIIKTYLYTENELLGCSISKVIARPDKQTDMTEIITYADGKKCFEYSQYPWFIRSIFLLESIAVWTLQGSFTSVLNHNWKRGPWLY